MPSDAPQLSIRSERDVEIAIYDAVGRKQFVGIEHVDAAAPRGLYRVHLERCGFVSEHLIRHDSSKEWPFNGPLVESPTPLEIARSASSDAALMQQIRRPSVETVTPVGSGPHTARLRVFVRRLDSEDSIAGSAAKEPISLHDVTGRRLAALACDAARAPGGHEVLACRIAPGTYRLRVGRAQRDLAITIAADRAAHVFLADSGTISLRHARVYLPRVGDTFDPRGEIARAMESVLWALRHPEGNLPPIARGLLPDIERDLSFGMACAHLARRQQDRATFAAIMRALADHGPELPDVALLARILETPDAVAPSPRFATPPLFRSTLVLALEHQREIAWHNALVQAAKAGYDDSVWCTWSPRWWDERWIDPTVERLRRHGAAPVAVDDLARSIRLPTNVVELALNRLDAAVPYVAGAPVPIERLSVPGYALHEVVGRGDRSIVFRARRDGDSRDVALKIVPLSSPEARGRIVQDVERAQRLGHKRLLRIDRFGVLPDESALWLELELCRENLFDHLAALDGPLGSEPASRLVLQALDALAYLHGQDVVHGRVHPGNLLLRSDGSVALGATGFAELEGEVERAVAADADIVRFLAPEILHPGGRATAASDVWSMAATLWFLVTLEPPRERHSDQSELDAARDSELSPVVGASGRLPVALATCLERALAPQPVRRFHDGRELRDAFAKALGACQAAQRAVELHDELVRVDAAYGDTIRSLFIRMSSLDGEVTRRRVRRADLTFRDPAETRRVEEVLRRFHDALLISFGSERTADGVHEFVEPVHDDLVRAWSSVRTWLEGLETVPGTRVMLMALEESVRAWDAGGRARSRLWSDQRARLAELIQRDRRFTYNVNEDEFVRSSRRRRQSWRVGVPAAMFALAMVSGCLYWRTGNALESASEAEQNLAGSLQETARRFVLDGDKSRAIPYLLVARKSGQAGPAMRMLFHAASRGLSSVSDLEHREAVRAATFSPDGGRVVTASADGTARVWDASTGDLIAWHDHKGSVVSAAFSADGKRVVTASEDGTAQVWEPATGKLLAPPLEHGYFVQSAVFSPDGRRIATASLDHRARIWDAATGMLEHELNHSDAVWSVVFSADGTRVVTASRDRTARIWSVATGDAVGAALTHRDVVWSASFNGDGTRVVTASQDKTARIWDAVTGAAITPPLEHRDGVVMAAFDRGGGRVVTASYDNAARVWDAATGAPVTSWLEHRGSVTSAAFSPNGASVLTASADEAARIWDVGTGRMVARFEHTGSVTSAVFSSDGTRALTASSDKTARVWDVSGDRVPVALELAGGMRDAAFSSSARWMATLGDDETVRLWDTATGKRSGSLLVQPALARTATFSPDDELVLTTAERTAQIWNRASGAVVGPPLEHEGRVTSAAFSPDGARIVTASENSKWESSLQIWDVATGARIPLALEYPEQITRASWSPDGTRLVTLNRDRLVRVWNTVTGKSVTGKSVTPLLAYAGGVTGVSFSPDGTRLVTAADDGTARVWNALTGALVAPPIIHPGRVLQASFSPDSGRIVTVCEDRSARVWDARTGKPLTQPLVHDEPIVSAAFSADGARLVTADGHAVRTWDVALDQGTLEDWANVARKSPYVLENGVLVLRSLALGGGAGRTHLRLPSS